MRRGLNRWLAASGAASLVAAVVLPSWSVASAADGRVEAAADQVVAVATFGCWQVAVDVAENGPEVSSVEIRFVDGTTQEFTRGLDAPEFFDLTDAGFVFAGTGAATGRVVSEVTVSAGAASRTFVSPLECAPPGVDQPTPPVTELPIPAKVRWDSCSAFTIIVEEGFQLRAVSVSSPSRRPLSLVFDEDAGLARQKVETGWSEGLASSVVSVWVRNDRGEALLGMALSPRTDCALPQLPSPAAAVFSVPAEQLMGVAGQVVSFRSCSALTLQPYPDRDGGWLPGSYLVSFSDGSDVTVPSEGAELSVAAPPSASVTAIVFEPDGAEAIPVVSAVPECVPGSPGSFPSLVSVDENSTVHVFDPLAEATASSGSVFDPTSLKAGPARFASVTVDGKVLVEVPAGERSVSAWYQLCDLQNVCGGGVLFAESPGLASQPRLASRLLAVEASSTASDQLEEAQFIVEAPADRVTVDDSSLLGGSVTAQPAVDPSRTLVRYVRPDAVVAGLDRFAYAVTSADGVETSAPVTVVIDPASRLFDSLEVAGGWFRVPEQQQRRLAVPSWAARSFTFSDGVSFERGVLPRERADSADLTLVSPLSVSFSSDAFTVEPSADGGVFLFGTPQQRSVAVVQSVPPPSRADFLLEPVALPFGQTVSVDVLAGATVGPASERYPLGWDIAEVEVSPLVVDEDDTANVSFFGPVVSVTAGVDQESSPTGFSAQVCVYGPCFSLARTVDAAPVEWVVPDVRLSTRLPESVLKPLTSTAAALVSGATQPLFVERVGQIPSKAGLLLPTGVGPLAGRSASVVFVPSDEPASASAPFTVCLVDFPEVCTSAKVSVKSQARDPEPTPEPTPEPSPSPTRPPVSPTPPPLGPPPGPTVPPGLPPMPEPTFNPNPAPLPNSEMSVDDLMDAVAGTLQLEAVETETLPGVPVTIDVLALARTASGEPVGPDAIIEVLDAPEAASVTVEGGRIVFAPNANYTGTVVFRYRVVSATGDQGTATVSVTITEPDLGPVPVSGGVNVPPPLTVPPLVPDVPQQAAAAESPAAGSSGSFPVVPAVLGLVVVLAAGGFAAWRFGWLTGR